MKIKFLATAESPDYYSFTGNIMYVVKDGVKEEIDFSHFESGDAYEGLELERLDMSDEQIIRDAERKIDGTLYLTLCQKSDDGHWRESDWMDSSEYQKGKTYIKEISDGEAQKDKLEGFI